MKPGGASLIVEVVEPPNTRLIRISLDYSSDFHHMSWTADGKVIANTFGWRSTMWKFLPEKR